MPRLRPASSAPIFHSSLVMVTLSAETVAVKPADTRLAGPVGQPGQKLSAQSAALPVVGDGDGDLGGPRVVSIPDVTGDAHATPLGGAERADRLVVVVVHVGEVAQFRR